MGNLMVIQMCLSGISQYVSCIFQERFKLVPVVFHGFFGVVSRVLQWDFKSVS